MHATFARADLSAGMVDLLHAAALRERFAPHMHEAYAIGVFERGSYRLRCGGTDYTTAPGDVVALEPGVIHSGSPLGETAWCTRMFYPDRQQLVHLLGDGACDWHPTFSMAIIRDRALANGLSSAHRALMSGRLLEGEKRLIEALAMLARRYGQSGARAESAAAPTGMRVVRDYIHANFAAPIRLTTLASLAGVSPYHLIRVFGREFGVSPYAYVKQLRVVRAQQMLRRGVSATETAFATGFSDQSHLNRAFKNMLGVTPGAFAQAVRPRGMTPAASPL
jgi:AraC-like DNA-binding protein